MQQNGNSVGNPVFIKEDISCLAFFFCAKHLYENGPCWLLICFLYIGWDIYQGRSFLTVEEKISRLFKSSIPKRAIKKNTVTGMQKQ